MMSILAPCVASLLPVLVARNAEGKRARSPLFIVLGLATSVFVFSILLKSTTVFLGVSQQTWQTVSGLIIIGFGLVTLFPGIWEQTASKLKLQQAGQKASSRALTQHGAWGDAVLGASLGPIFSACSPTYGLIVAVILPTEPTEGLLYLTAFVAGLSAMLYLVLVGGSTVVRKLGWGINPHGWFKRIVGVLFVLVGISILTGFDKDILSWLVENGWFDWQMSLEDRFGM
jgi:cytochrome c biogenesis protein CcdA